ncbi:MAG: hypothetical protein EBV02_03970 [Actinobacteria bacterium]|nr:hypothetical protein [Actinomycetota bacterium]
MVEREPIATTSFPADDVRWFDNRHGLGGAIVVLMSPCGLGLREAQVVPQRPTHSTKERQEVQVV